MDFFSLLNFGFQSSDGPIRAAVHVEFSAIQSSNNNRNHKILGDIFDYGFGQKVEVVLDCLAQFGLYIRYGIIVFGMIWPHDEKRWL